MPKRSPNDAPARPRARGLVMRERLWKVRRKPALMKVVPQLYRSITKGLWNSKNIGICMKVVARGMIITKNIFIISCFSVPSRYQVRSAPEHARDTLDVA